VQDEDALESQIRVFRGHNIASKTLHTLKCAASDFF